MKQKKENGKSDRRSEYLFAHRSQCDRISLNNLFDKWHRQPSKQTMDILEVDSLACKSKEHNAKTDIVSFDSVLCLNLTTTQINDPHDQKHRFDNSNGEHTTVSTKENFNIHSHTLKENINIGLVCSSCNMPLLLIFR